MSKTVLNSCSRLFFFFKMQIHCVYCKLGVSPDLKNKRTSKWTQPRPVSFFANKKFYKNNNTDLCLSRKKKVLNNQVVLIIMLKNVDMSNAFILCVCNFAVSSWQYQSHQSQVSIVPLYTLRKMHFILQQPLLSFYVLLSVLCFYFWFYFISWKMLESLHSLLSFFFSCITTNIAFLKWLKTSAFTQELHLSQNFKGHLGPCMKNLAPLNSFFFFFPPLFSGSDLFFLMPFIHQV